MPRVKMLRDLEEDIGSTMYANYAATERLNAAASGQCVGVVRILRSHVSTRMASETESRCEILSERDTTLSANCAQAIWHLDRQGGGL